MRICFIALGRFTHIPAYLEYFAEAGYDVHFVALAPGPARGVPTHNVGGSVRLPSKLGYLPAMWRARRVVRSLAPDIVHAHYATSAGLAAYVCGVHPYVVTAHGTDVRQGAKSILWRSILRQVFHSADYVNPVSDELKDEILGLGISAQKVETFTLGIDTRRFSFQGGHSRALGSPLRLICTRQLEEVYDHKTLIGAMAILARQRIDFRLTLVGDGALRERLGAYAREQGIGEQTTFMGAVPNGRLPELLASHDVYLSASTSDGTSLSLLEAMASGIYPVVSNIPANQVWLSHGYNGLLHRVSEPQSLADCVLALLRDPGQVQKALRVNRELVELRGDRTANMKHLEEVYHRLRRRAPSAAPLLAEVG